VPQGVRTDELVCAAEQLRGEDDDRGGAVAHLLVLQLREANQNLASWMVYLQFG